jgi:hypothetical protein
MVLRLRREAPRWELAKCADTHPVASDDPWFDNSDEDSGGYEDITEEGRDFCNGVLDGVVCPIRHQCLVFALVNNERQGVWGGTSEADRKAIRKKWPWRHSLGDQPHPEWKWHPPGEVAATLPDKNQGDDDED